MQVLEKYFALCFNIISLIVECKNEFCCYSLPVGKNETSERNAT